MRGKCVRKGEQEMGNMCFVFAQYLELEVVAQVSPICPVFLFF